MTYKIQTTKPKAAALTYLCSCRVRLTQEMRAALKEGLNAHRLSQPVQGLPGSTVRTETYSNVNSKFSDVVMSDLISTRESLSLAIILELEKVFNVSLISKDDLRVAFDGYLDHVYGDAQ